MIKFTANLHKSIVIPLLARMLSILNDVARLLYDV